MSRFVPLESAHFISPAAWMMVHKRQNFGSDQDIRLRNPSFLSYPLFFWECDETLNLASPVLHAYGGAKKVMLSGLEMALVTLPAAKWKPLLQHAYVKTGRAEIETLGVIPAEGAGSLRRHFFFVTTNCCLMQFHILRYISKNSNSLVLARIILVNTACTQ